ncbi:DHA2 family efflux MFS transporter permease subunit [Rathayibacter sp. VKM Ac-2803]|uniref:DHA2 family efflux MFS transporter permease subunit n=1 Tax=unclassified Rathayibacter TaxID=2609250 RepID=UPI00135B13F1|nr:MULTISPECIES: DHA2 family efflux MFS transporter permease subunit [unclassified Rathayibacter]MWV47783.1 DHA2 family efflux MFS transporter permease subunit [Rathayibacter sp. VKM Ac-2803]MWV59006.1 DHA2 family efflux MFS transporter permease subunit [Rathayibacter sp. VKM Ac-2754]
METPAAGRRRLTLLLCSSGFFLITLDILIVNVALTAIGRDLGGDTVALQWTIDSYTLVFAALLLLAGNLSERLGAKRAFRSGIVLFAVASIACALAPSIELLITARAVQGAGAAVMLPASMALIREAYADDRERTRALGVWAVGGAVATAVGPVLGGALTTGDWRLVFAINLPVCVLMLVLLRAVGRSPVATSPFDWAGQLASLVGLTALVFGLIEGGAVGFTSPLVLTSLSTAVAAIVLFLVIQARVQHPMMPLDLFRSSGMRISLGVGFAFMVSNFGTVFVLSLFLQQQLGLPPLLAGLVFLPGAGFSILGNIASGALANRFGTRVPIVSGLLLMALGLVLAVVTAPLASPVLVGAAVCLTGLGGAVTMPPVTSVVLSSVPPARAGTASAVFNTFRQVGGAVAIAVFGAFIADRASFVPGLQLSLTVAAVLIVGAAVASLFLRTGSASVPT